MSNESNAAMIARYIADLIENAIGSGQLTRDLAADGLEGFTSAEILAASTEATRLAADLIYTGKPQGAKSE